MKYIFALAALVLLALFFVPAAHAQCPNSPNGTCPLALPAAPAPTIPAAKPAVAPVKPAQPAAVKTTVVIRHPVAAVVRAPANLCRDVHACKTVWQNRCEARQERRAERQARRCGR